MQLPKRPRLCFVSYRHIREFARPMLEEFSDRADIDVVDATFDDALTVAKGRIAHGLVDAFVSAGSNASILRNGVHAPVALIQLTGFDLLQVLLKARLLSNRVGIVMYGRTIPELEAVKELLNIEIIQYEYRTKADAKACFESLRADGFEVIVGSSLVVELAEECGLVGLLAYSLSSIRRALEDAIEMARVAWLEASRYEQLNGVLHSLQEAVLAVDAGHRIIAVNQPMQGLLRMSAVNLLGQKLDQIEPDLSLHAALKSGLEQRAVAKRFARRDWIIHSAPIREHGLIVGAALTLYDAHNIEAADTSLRIQQRKRQRPTRHSFSSLLGQSATFEKALQRARRFAATELTVLLTGETGTGKELFAQAIHNESPRAAHPFVAVNCASFPESLLESELFGYEEGAFTGARRGGKSGLIEAAHMGTLFFDEIGDMPTALQSRLLRVLQEREVTRLGSSSAIPVDIRCIAATHQPLVEMVQHKLFREDLYYRLNMLSMTLPPLRERSADILPLAHEFLSTALLQLHSTMNPAAILARIERPLVLHAWPGNIRELQNICQRLAVFFASHKALDAVLYADLVEECPEIFSGGVGCGLGGSTEGLEPERVAEAMRLAKGRQERAAKILGISRSTLWRWRQSHPEASLPKGEDRAP